MSWFVVAQVEVRCWVSVCLVCYNYLTFESISRFPLTHRLITQSWFQDWELWHATQVWGGCDRIPPTPHPLTQSYVRWLLLSPFLPLPEAFRAFSCSMLACQTKDLHNTLIFRVCAPSGQQSGYQSHCDWGRTVCLVKKTKTHPECIV